MQRGIRSLPTVTVIALAALAGFSAGASAQPAAIRAGDDLRTLAATPMDIAEGKRLAEMNCAACHGVTGISSIAGTPHLAGQRPPYLYLEIKAYQSGARGNSAMNNAVKFLSDDALTKVAAYFGSLDPAPPPPGPARAANPDPLQVGKGVAAACTGCHGDTGVSQIPIRRASPGSTRNIWSRR